MSTATQAQLHFLLDLAWKRCDISEDELKEYYDRFQAMTNSQAADLISAWNELPVIRDTPRPLLTIPAPSVPAPTTAPAQPAPNSARLMNAKFNSTCSKCHDQITVGQQIYYTKGFIATHAGCGIPTVQSGSVSHPYKCRNQTGMGMCNAAFGTAKELDEHRQQVHNVAIVTQTPAPTQPTPAPPVFKCRHCNAEFMAIQQRNTHENEVHPAPTAPPPIPLPEKGYFAVEVPINGVPTMRFYRVTERQVSQWDKTKVKTFLRQSSDNWVTIETSERTIAAAIINAAPILAKEAYGKLIGSCGNCGRTLTDPVSRARGIGPECIKHYPGRYN